MDSEDYLLTIDFSDIKSIDLAQEKLPRILFESAYPVAYLKENYNSPMDLFTQQCEMNDVAFTLLMALRCAKESIDPETIVEDKDKILLDEANRIFNSLSDKWNKMAENYSKNKKEFLKK